MVSGSYCGALAVIVAVVTVIIAATMATKAEPTPWFCLRPPSQPSLP